MKMHYLEIISIDVEAVCRAYEAAHGVTFGEPDALLGGARTITLADGSMVGVRAPLRKSELPITRPYWLVDDIEEALAAVTALDVEVALSTVEIPGKGKLAVYIDGGVEIGLWQL